MAVERRTALDAMTRALEDGTLINNDLTVPLSEIVDAHEAIDWAKSSSHAPLVARVRNLNDKKRPDHWRAA